MFIGIVPVKGIPEIVDFLLKSSPGGGVFGL
jgi:hypothetical protein